MSKVIERIKAEWEEHKGEFVLTQSHTLERFIAIGDDEEDYYYVTYDGRRVMWNSCVGKLIYLKGKIDEGDYNEFIRLAKMNHYDQDDLWLPRTDEEKAQQKHYAKKHKQKMEKEEGTNKYLTDICWDLN